MKKSLIILLVILASCAKPKSYIIEVTYFNGDRDTAYIENIKNPPFLSERGNLEYYPGTWNNTMVLACSVRSFKIIKQ